jgi:Methyltransferase domain
VCGGASEAIFSKRILRTHDIGYFRCGACTFMQTEEPYWLAEAYGSPLARCDIGMIARPLANAAITCNVIRNHFDPGADFMDFGGGSGVFTRHMRDQGFRFFHHDKFADNLFAQFFAVSDRAGASKFELVTAFEVFEHFDDPMAGIDEILSYGDSVFFSTVLQPQDTNALAHWDYLSELSGQHVSFYSIRSLETIATRFNCHFHTDGAAMHLLTRRELGSFSVNRGLGQKIGSFLRHPAARRPRQKSLTPQDSEYVLARLTQTTER